MLKYDIWYLCINFPPAFLAVSSRCFHVTCYSPKIRKQRIFIIKFLLRLEEILVHRAMTTIKIAEGTNLQFFLESLLFILSVKLSCVEDNWDDCWLLQSIEAGQSSIKGELFLSLVSFLLKFIQKYLFLLSLYFLFSPSASHIHFDVNLSAFNLNNHSDDST